MSFRRVITGSIPSIKTLGNATGGTYAQHMKDAVFLIGSPALLAAIIDQLEQIPMEDRDTNEDIFFNALMQRAFRG